MTNPSAKVYAGVLFVALSVVSLSLATLLYGLGPRVLWASDVCPSPSVTCGVAPLAIFPLVGGIAVIVAVLQTTNPNDGQNHNTS